MQKTEAFGKYCRKWKLLTGCTGITNDRFMSKQTRQTHL